MTKRKAILGIAGCRDDSRFDGRRERSMGRSRNADTNDVRAAAGRTAKSQAVDRLRPLPRAGTHGASSLVGSWLEKVTFRTDRPPLKSLIIFHGDGTPASNDQGSVTTDPP